MRGIRQKLLRRRPDQGGPAERTMAVMGYRLIRLTTDPCAVMALKQSIIIPMSWQEKRPANAIGMRSDRSGQADPAFADPTSVVPLFGATIQARG